MTHFIILVHNQISELIFKRRLAEEKSGHKLTLFPYKEYNSRIIEALTEKFSGHQLEQVVIIAEANYGSPSNEEVNSALFACLKTIFPKARIIAHSCTVSSLVSVLNSEPTFEVMINGDGENDTIELKRQTNKELHTRILTRADIFAMASSSKQVKRINSDGTECLDALEQVNNLTYKFDQLSVTATNKDKIAPPPPAQDQQLNTVTKAWQSNKL